MPSPAALPHVARCSIALAALALASTLGAQGRIRELSCRGKAEIALKVDLDPSLRDTADVVMSLDCTRSTAVIHDSLQLLAPGGCTWNSYGFEGYPVEPGRLRFDVRRQAQRWSDTATRFMDTTAGAARFFSDPITLPRYLSDPRHYWKFYVDDVTNLAVSHSSIFDDGLPTYVTIRAPVVLANDVRRDLLCRGGTTGLTFGGGTDAGDNLEINLINDGDSGSDGEVKFGFISCTPSIDNAVLSGKDGEELSWGDGRHWLVLDLKSVAEVPDQFRTLVDGTEYDKEFTEHTRAIPQISCSRPDRPPGKTPSDEWNSLVMDFDLTKYPGPKNGDSFVRRSQPPSGGAQLEFEIKGYWEVTRQ